MTGQARKRFASPVKAAPKPIVDAAIIEARAPFAPTSMLLLARRLELVEAIVSWTVISHKPYSPPKGKPPEDSEAFWTWAWSEVEVPYKLMSRAMAVTLSRARICVDLLISHRLILPGGKVPSGVWACVVEISAERLKAAAGRSK